MNLAELSSLRAPKFIPTSDPILLHGIRLKLISTELHQKKKLKLVKTINHRDIILS